MQRLFADQRLTVQYGARMQALYWPAYSTIYHYVVISEWEIIVEFVYAPGSPGEAMSYDEMC